MKGYCITFPLVGVLVKERKKVVIYKGVSRGRKGTAIGEEERTIIHEIPYKHKLSFL